MRKTPLYKCLTKLTLCHNLWDQSKSSLDSRIKQKRGDLKEKPTEQADFKIYCDYFDAGQSENLNPLESNPKEYLNYRSTDGPKLNQVSTPCQGTCCSKVSTKQGSFISLFFILLDANHFQDICTSSLIRSYQAPFQAL